MTNTALRVLLDATAIPADRGGVGRYVEELLHGLVRQGADLVVVCQARDVERMRCMLPGVEVVGAPTSVERRIVRLIWEQIALPALARRVGAQVLHSPHYTTPVLSRIPSVVTLHDATFFTHPDLHAPTKRRFFQAWTRWAVRHANALVVPSLSTRDAVIAHAGGRPESFHVAYHGVDTAVFRPVDGPERARVAHDLGLGGQPYIAFLGTLEPRKNVPALIRGWVRACRQLPEPPALVLAGGPGWDGAVEPAVAAVPADLRLVRAGYLPLGDLAGYLSGALVVAYPSVGEGFGLPVLEAMACGATVLTTRETSLPEVGGDAVAYTGLSDSEIERELLDLVNDAPRRRALGVAARARAEEFTWDEAAARHLAAYRAAVRG